MKMFPEGRMMQVQIAIWGIGKELQKYAQILCMEQVVCFVDSNRNPVSQFLYGKKVISPDELKDYCIDYVVISSNKFFDEIANQLVTELGFDCKKILNFEYYLYLLGKVSLTRVKLVDIILQLIVSYRIHKILDVEMLLLDTFIWKKDVFFQIDGYSISEIQEKLQYEKIWSDSELIQEKYDLTILLQPEQYDLKKIFKIFCPVSANVLIKVTREIFENKEWMQEGSLVNFRGYLFFALREKRETSLKIFEVSHKQFVSLKDSIYCPLYVAGAMMEEPDVLKDSDGNSIAEYNNKINECTALYWIWKNTEYKCVGLNHYRRFFTSFVNKYNALQEWEIHLLLDFYDIGVAESVFFNTSVRDVLQKQIAEEAFSYGFEELQKIFEHMDKRNQEAFKYVMDGHRIYPCNMFITTKKILNSYCAWLFPILFELIERVKVKENWDNYSKRVLGFLAERLWTVWLIQQNYKIKEFPILCVGQEGPYGK